MVVPLPTTDSFASKRVGGLKGAKLPVLVSWIMRSESARAMQGSYRNGSEAKFTSLTAELALGRAAELGREQEVSSSCTCHIARTASGVPDRQAWHMSRSQSNGLIPYKAMHLNAPTDSTLTPDLARLCNRCTYMKDIIRYNTVMGTDQVR